ncbi:MAG TPA: glycosyltransferase family 9 protein, partial [Chitinophagaceae bacterium]|nr:glycosyltransferase family 9 protein [Chitinophagaceae bacterium]
KKIKIIALTEHIGDIIAAEPVARYIKGKFPESKIIWIVNKNYRELVINHPGIKQCRTVTCFTEWIFLKRIIKRKNLFDLHISGKVCQKHGWKILNDNRERISIENYLHKGNLLYCFSRTAGLDVNETIAPQIQMKPAHPEWYPQKGKIIVIHTSSNLAEKNWTTGCWNRLTEYLIKEYKADTIIETGFESNISLKNPSIFRYCGTQSLCDIHYIISKCSLFIGIESGFAHMANALEKESIILAGRLPQFEKYMPYSGKFMKESASTILFFDKHMQEVSFDELLPRFREMLEKKK